VGGVAIEGVITDLALVAALWGTGLAVGASTEPTPATWRVAPRWLALALLLNLVVVPAVAIALVRIAGLSTEATTGVVLFSSAAGGAIALVSTRIGRGDVPRAIVLVVLLELLDLVAIPVWTSVTLSSGATVPIADVARTLLVLLLLPLAIGVAVRIWRPALAPRLVAIGSPLSVLGLVVAVIAVVIRNGPTLWDLLGTGLPIVSLVLVVGGWLAGYALGGPLRGQQRALGMVTASRSSALALAIVRAAYPGQPGAEAAIVVAGLITILVPVVVGFALAASDRRAAAGVPLAT
jgi:bile acid:Na+ symporter, BASS family